MSTNQDPSLNPDVSPEQGPDSALLDGEGVVQRLRSILTDREVTAENQAAILEDNPKLRTLIETGQIDSASALKRVTGTATTELPIVKPSKRKRVNTRGGRAYNEGDDSEHDDAWNAPVTDVAPDEAAETLVESADDREASKARKAHREYVEDLKTGKPGEALAHLRNKGYIPNPATRGTTLIKIAPARVPFSQRRPSRKQFFKR
jgi:hypothetical protein